MRPSPCRGKLHRPLFRRRAPNRGAGLPWRALQSIVFPACPMAARCRSISVRCWPMEGFPQYPDRPVRGRLSLYDGEALTGDSITALLTRQYTDSRRNGLKELLNLLEDRPGWSDPLADDGGGRAAETGAIATGQSDYTAPRSRRRSALCCWASARKCAMRFRLERGGEHPAAAADLFWGQMGGRNTHPHPDGGSLCTVRRWKHDPETLEAALLDELQRRLAALNTQMSRTRSDLLGLSARAALCGHDLQNIPFGSSATPFIWSCGIPADFCHRTHILASLSFCCIRRKYLHHIIRRFRRTVDYGAAHQCGRGPAFGERGEIL